MATIPANIGFFTWSAPRPYSSGSFRPTGKIHHHGPKPNPIWQSKRTLAGRLIVGFNVEGEPKYTLKDLVAIVTEVRREQVGDPSSTFISQTGIYQHKKSGLMVQEDGAQVVIIDTSDTKKKKFTRQMLDLAEIIVKRMEQEMVIVEIQKNGVGEEGNYVVTAD